MRKGAEKTKTPALHRGGGSAVLGRPAVSWDTMVSQDESGVLGITASYMHMHMYMCNMCMHMSTCTMEGTSVRTEKRPAPQKTRKNSKKS